jgi:hypothetical protein
MSRIKTRLDEKNRAAEASVLRIPKSHAIFRPGLGCTLCADGANEIGLRKQAIGVTIEEPLQSDEIWPDGDAVAESLPSEIRPEDLKTAIDMAFDETSEHLLRTRAVVIYDGRIVAVHYAPGITKDTPLLGWSKSNTG